MKGKVEVKQEKVGLPVLRPLQLGVFALIAQLAKVQLCKTEHTGLYKTFALFFERVYEFL
ncbi:MAG: hypothetical protein L0229_18155 [Blastocatellia bacterium]|nr:hypothetical protein [Blastocatellia bacterium]